MRLSQEILSAKRLEWPKFACAIALMIFFIFIISVIYVGIFARFYPSDGDSLFANLFDLLSVATWHIAIALTVWLIFKRKYLNLINPMRFRIKAEAMWAIGFSLGFLVINDLTSLIFFKQSVVYNFVMNPTLWLIWLVPMGLVILFQSSAEEFLFRGFLQQYLAGLGVRKWVFILTPAIIWSSLHFWNFTDPILQFSAVLQVLVMGIIWGHWTYRTRTMYGAIIMHFVNNFYLIQISGNSLEPSQLNIWRSEIDMSQIHAIVIATLMLSIIHLIIYFAYVRKKLPDRTAV